MDKLTRNDLYSLEEYAQRRPEFRARLMQHKKARLLALGLHVALYFEDRLTIQYQVQEMLRAERIFEPTGIEEELQAYVPLIPDGRNWKATLMLEYDDPVQRRTALARLIGIEDHVWVQVAGFERVQAIADEDLDRETPDKTSSVHFLRFELSDTMCEAVKAGANINAGIAHAHYSHTLCPIPRFIRDSLAQDLD
ncbi:MAG: DUF3501 family protein [Gammaproteobacteria bacterium]